MEHDGFTPVGFYQLDERKGLGAHCLAIGIVFGKPRLGCIPRGARFSPSRMGRNWQFPVLVRLNREIFDFNPIKLRVGAPGIADLSFCNGPIEAGKLP